MILIRPRQFLAKRNMSGCLSAKKGVSNGQLESNVWNI
jgi:hypothetical protein